MLEWILRSVLYEEGDTVRNSNLQIYSVDDLYREKLDERKPRRYDLAAVQRSPFEKEGRICRFSCLDDAGEPKIYPYEGRLEIQGKCSVSEIKRQSQIQEPERRRPKIRGIVLIKESEDTATVPKFLEAKEERVGR